LGLILSLRSFVGGMGIPIQLTSALFTTEGGL
jgi:hypothetical protein